MTEAITFSVCYHVYNGVRREFVQDSEGNIYNDDSKSFIRFKAVALVAATPILIALHAICQLAACLNPQTCANNSRTSCKDILQLFLLGCCMTKEALRTIYSPYEGRRAYGLLESDIYQNKEHIYGHEHPVYLAVCFQPLVKISDENYLEVLDKYSHKFPTFAEMWLEGLGTHRA